MGNIQVKLEGRGQLTLRPSDHIATGGEGSVYKASGTVVKLYSDLGKMQRDGMVGKIRQLIQLSNRYIVAPKGLVTDLADRPVGYYMPYVSGEPLARVFTNDFRKRSGFTDDHASDLVYKMRQTVQAAHGFGAVMVDANEMNWLAQDTEPRVIDVDSWAIGRWPATVIMPSIRDWHSKKLDQHSDWFAWGVVTFQVYSGIHPYKGKLDGYKPGEMERRMKDNASVFSPGVRLNNAVRDFSGIPGKLLDWYVGAFQHGKRGVPPSPLDAGVATASVGRVLHATTTASGALVFEKIYVDTSSPVIKVFPCGVVLTANEDLIDLDTKHRIGSGYTPECEVIKTENGWLLASAENALSTSFFHVNASNMKNTYLDPGIRADRLLRSGNRLFAVTDRGLTEILFKNLGKPMLVAGNTWGVLANSTRWFDGVGIMDAIGATYVVAPFGDNACAQVRVKELDGLKPVAAKAGNRFVTVVGLDKAGTYQKIELTFNRGYTAYSAWCGATDTPDLNIAILPKGVCATIVEDGELDIFVPTSGTLNKVQDKFITTDMALVNWGDKVVYIKDGAVWSVRMG